jgi:hypothetical protein
VIEEVNVEVLKPQEIQSRSRQQKKEDEYEYYSEDDDNSSKNKQRQPEIIKVTRQIKKE